MAQIVNESDTRFMTITNCEFAGLYQGIPHVHRKWLLGVRFKKNDTDFFSQSVYLRIDSSTFLDELVRLEKVYKKSKKTKERAVLAHGMTDVDMYFAGNMFIIRWSPSDGAYLYYQFSIDKFAELMKEVNFHLKNIANEQ